MQKKKIAIVGAGPSGLACAYALKKAGIEAQIFEKEKVAGGRVKTYSKDGYVFNCGATTLGTSFTRFIELCKELGIHHKLKLLERILRPSNSFEAFGKGVYAFITFPSEETTIWQRIQIALTLGYYLLKFKEKDPLQIIQKNSFFSNITAHDGLAKYCGEEVVKKTIEVLYSSITMVTLKQVTLGDLIGFIKMRKDSEVCFFEEGIYLFIEALVQKLSVALSTPVLSVIGGHKPRILIKTAKQEKELEYDAVVLATLPAAAEKIYKNPTQSQFNILKKARYICSLRVAFLITPFYFKDRKFLLFREDESFLLTSYNCSQAIYNLEVHPTTCGLKGVASVGMRDEASRLYFNTPDEEVFQMVKEELLRLKTPFQHCMSDIESFFIQRWEHSCPVHSPEDVPRINQFWQCAQGEQNVYLTGDYLNCYWVEGAMRSGEEVACRIINSSQ